MTALLPALWLAVLATGLAALLRLCFDPVPRRFWLYWGAALAALFLPVLAGGRSQLPLGYLGQVPPYSTASAATATNLAQSDLVLHVTPWLVQIRGAWLEGRWPLWNALAGCGEPLLANPQSQGLQPLVLLALPFPADAAAGAIGALRTLVAFVFFSLLLLRLGFHPTTALWGSLSYGLSGFLQSWLGWPLANIAALTPLLLYAIVRVEQSGRARDGALLAFATAAVLLGGHPETELHLALFSAAFALSRLFGKARGERFALLRRWIVAAGLGAALAAPALLPAANFLPRTQRAALLAERQAQTAYSAAIESGGGTGSGAGLAPDGRLHGPLARLVPAVAPYALGNNRFGRYWGDRNVIDDASAFAGTAALLGLAAAFLSGWGRGSRRLPHERLALGTALFALVVVARPPLLPPLFDALPVFRSSLGYHARLASLFCFAASYLAACGWERWRRGELSRLRVAAGAGLVGAAILAAYLATPLPGDLPVELLRLRRAAFALQLATFAGAAGVLLLRPPSGEEETGVRGRPRFAALTASLALVIAVEPILFQRATSPSAPRALFYPPTKTTAFLQRHLDPWHRMAGIGAALRPSFATVYGLADARSSSPTRLSSVRDYLRPINRFPDRPTDGFFAPLHPLYPRLGVRYLLTTPRDFLPPPYRLAFRSREGWIYRNPEARPLLFLVPLEGGELEAGGSREGEDSAAGSMLRLGVASSARLSARALLGEGRDLRSGVVQEGNWKLLRNGRPWPAPAAGTPFLAARLPAGESELELLYRPWTFVAGLGIAAVALAVGAASWVRPPRSTGRAQTARRSQTAISRSA